MADQDRVERKFRQDQEEKESFEHELEDLENRIARLRVLYDQYFMGIEKLEPMQMRTAVEKIFLRSRVPLRGSTVLKFRFRSLQQKFTSFTGYWDRIVRLIEEGSIRRGIAGRMPTRSEVAQNVAIKESILSKRKRFYHKKEEGTPETPSTPASPPRDEFSPTEVEAIHAELLSRKLQAGEDTSRLNVELLRRSIEKIVERVPHADLRLRITRGSDGKIQLSAVVRKDA